MEATFDLFRQQIDGQLLWLKAVEGLDESKRQLSLLSEKTPGNYFIYDSRVAKVIVRATA
jgi:hypothetical protein